MKEKTTKIIKIVICGLLVAIFAGFCIACSIELYRSYYPYREVKLTTVKRGGIMMGHVVKETLRSFTKIGYKSDRRSFDVDNVTLSVGVMSTASWQEYDDPNPHHSAFEYWVADEDGNEALLKRIEENICCKKYGKKTKAIPFSKCYVQLVYQYVSVTIPSEMFAKESGELSLMVRLPRQDQTYSTQCKIPITYTASGDRVSLKQTERYFEPRSGEWPDYAVGHM